MRRPIRQACKPEARLRVTSNGAEGRWLQQVLAEKDWGQLPRWRWYAREIREPFAGKSDDWEAGQLARQTAESWVEYHSSIEDDHGWAAVALHSSVT